MRRRGSEAVLAFGRAQPAKLALVSARRWCYARDMKVMSDNFRGAALMSASMACFTINDAMMKALGQSVPFFQALFLRGCATTVLMLALAMALGAFKLRVARQDRLWIALRTLSEIGAAYFFITALFHMPIANVTAVLQALPLTVTLAGALFLGEPVGWRRMAAILVGLVGVILIVRPGPGGFDQHALYALVAVVCVTLRDIATRRLSSSVPSLSVAWAGALGVTLFGGLGAATIDWAPMGSREWSLLSGSALFILVAYLLSVMVMRRGEISFITPFRYTGLLWALLLGLVVFDEWPDALTLLGAAIVVATGIFTLWREARLSRRARAAA